MLNKLLLATFLVLTVAVTSGCSPVVEPMLLGKLAPDASLQEKFEIEASPLTFATAQTLNLQKYERLVSRPGKAFSADLVKEIDLTRSSYPPQLDTAPYLVGSGDELVLTQELARDTSLGTLGGLINLSGVDEGQVQVQGQTQVSSLINDNTSTFIKTSGRVGTDGSLLLIGVGQIEARGKTIGMLRDEVREILISNGKSPNFQLEISGFNSQRAFITPNNNVSIGTQEKFVFHITDQKITLKELIASFNIRLDEELLTLVSISRDAQTYSFPLSELFSGKAPEIYVMNNDHIFIQNFQYVPGKVYLVGGVTPTILPIKPEQRQTLAEALFTKNGPLEVQTAQRSAIYLLRGQNPVKAYHLDAQNPARLLVADAVELRPNDIVFVGEQPINTFNRTLSTILPLRIFSRDIQNDNLP